MTSLRGTGVLVSLAAAVTLALTIRRILQRRRARPGELIAMPEETSPAEAHLAQAAQAPAADGIHRLDLALRTLAHAAEREGQDLPAVRGARITNTAVQVLPGDLTAAPLTPFTASQAGWWTLDHTIALTDDLYAEAPYPGLVPLGADASGDLVLLNLPHTGVVLLDGEREQVEEVLTSLALELGMSPWADGVEVVVAGFGEGLNHLLPTARIAHMRHPSHAAQDFAERLLEAHQERDTGLKPAPYLILCAAELDADSAWQIAETLSRADGLMKAAVIIPAQHGRPLFDEGELLDTADVQPQRIDSLGIHATVQHLDREAFEEICAALAVSGQEPQPAQGAWRHVPSEAQTARSAHAAAAAAREPGEAAQGSEARSACSSGPDVPVAASPDDTADNTDRRTPADNTDAQDDLGVFTTLLTAANTPSNAPSDPAVTPRGREPDGHPVAEPPVVLPQQAPAALADLHVQGESVGTDRGHPTATATAPSARPGSTDIGVPFIRVLGPVSISGAAASRHSTREAHLAALIHLRPGRDAGALCRDMDPSNPWSPSTLNARLGGLRRSLGTDADGNSYVPRRAVKSDPFVLSDKICCDWHTFQRTVEDALPHGLDGVSQLEQALNQVRGRPFGTQALPWSQPLQQEMAMRIVAIAHTVATHRLKPGPTHDLALARRAIATGLEADEVAELLYRDWFRIEAAADNRSGLNAAIARLEQINRSLGLPMELETEGLIRELLDKTSPSHHR
ncbi:hypothetical protein [Streptomyces sp. NPDC059063]|uniref:hypothetical protein n=1 Tax=unclassified Streptomyces TaxID=2593676 RepID=UPI0036ACEED8